MPTDPPGDSVVTSSDGDGFVHHIDEAALGKVVVGEEEIRARIAALGDEITRDYAGRTPLLICVLKGAFIFLADLARSIRLPLEVDFMAVSSYGASTKSSGVVRIVKDLDLDLTGRHVILVEDIVDSGLTLDLPAPQPRGPPAGQPRRLRPVRPAGQPEDAGGAALRRLRDPAGLRAGLRARRRGALPEPALRVRVQPPA